MVQIGRYATCETPKRFWPSFRTEKSHRLESRMIGNGAPRNAMLNP